MKTCFIIMPLTTPDHYVETYKGDPDHFIHVLDHLFKPAIIAAGMKPIEPISKGSPVIHGDIIRHIETADLVLCDMSILNPNVFFELGIRTALNKSVAMVKDDSTPKIPFDTGIINHHTYKSDGLTAWDVDAEVKSLKTHLEDCMENGGHNSLWSYFSMSQQAEVPKDAPKIDQQMGYLIKQVDSLRTQINDFTYRKRVVQSNDLGKMDRIMGALLRGDDTITLSNVTFNRDGIEINTDRPISALKQAEILNELSKLGFNGHVNYLKNNSIYVRHELVQQEEKPRQ